MAHEEHEHQAAIAHVESHSGAAAKKEALFDVIHDMLVKDIAECERVGNLDALKHGVAQFEAHRHHWVAMDLS